MKSTIYRNISLGNYELAFLSNIANKVEEERFSAAKPSHNKANGGSSLFDQLQIVDESSDLVESSDLNMVQTNSRYDTSRE